MLTIWGRRSAFNVQKVLWLIGELDLSHRWIDAGGDAGGLDTSDFLAMNPNGRVPVIEDDGVVVWESHAIIRYLAARYGGRAWWPDDPADRSRADRWMDWSQTTLQPAFMGAFWAFYRTPEAQHDPAVIEGHLALCDQAYAVLDRVLAERPYLAGENFTLADLPAGATLHRYFEMGAPVPGLPHVRAWRARLAKRPAYRAHIAQPFEALKGRLNF